MSLGSVQPAEDGGKSFGHRFNDDVGIRRPQPVADGSHHRDMGLARNPNLQGPGTATQVYSRGPEVFTTPWARITYRRPLGSGPEFVCAERSRDYVGRTIDIPHADKPDF
jgi:hypothetical protein